MTDTPGPGPEADATPVATDAAAEPATPRRQPGWRRLNRNKRIAALVLGGVGAVFVAALIFGAGVMVGAEFGGSEGHHHESG